MSSDPVPGASLAPQEIWWTRLEQMRRDFRGMELEAAKTQQRLDDMDRNYDRLIKAIEDSRVEAKSESRRIELLLGSLNTGFQEISKEISRHKGGFEIVKLGIIIGIPTIGLVLTAVTIFGP